MAHESSRVHSETGARAHEHTSTRARGSRDGVASTWAHEYTRMRLYEHYTSCTQNAPNVPLP